MIVFVALSKGKVPVQLNIKSFDDLIIHKKILKVTEEGVVFSSGWSVTHVASGYSVFSFETKWQAKFFKERTSFLDWTEVDVVASFSSEQKNILQE